MENKRFTKTLRLRIVRPFYNEAEAIIEQEKNQREAQEKTKKARKLDIKFWNELKEKYSEIVSPGELFDVLQHIQRKIIPIYNEASAMLYQKILRGLKAKKGNEKTAIQYVVSKYAYPLAYKETYNSHIALGVGIKLRASFSNEKLRKIKTAQVSSPSATSGSFPITFNVDNGFKISKSNNEDFIINIPFPWYEIVWGIKKDKKTNEEKKYREITLLPKKGSSLNNIKLILSTYSRKKNDNWQKDFSTEAEIKKVMSGEYEVKTIEIIKGKRIQERYIWFVNLITSFDKPVKQLNKEITGGIDIGVSNPVVCAIHEKLNRLTINDNDVRDFTRAEIARIRSLRTGDRFRRGGHGIKYKFSPSDTIQKKYDERRKKKIEEWASRVNNFFVNNNVGLVYMEKIDAEEIKRGEDYFHTQLRITWPIAKMMGKIKAKLESNGIRVEERNPAYSSQVCSECGKWKKNFTFKDRQKNNFPPFECENCSYGTDANNPVYADYNAAKNLANPKFDIIVEREIPENTRKKSKEDSEIQEE